MANPVSLWGNAIETDNATGLDALGSVDEADPKHVPGTVVCTVDADDGLKCFRYYRYDNGTANLTLANGNPLLFDDAAALIDCTADVSDSNRNLISGIALGAITDLQYGWQQVTGYHSAVDTNGDDDIVIGQSLIHSNTDQQVDSVAVGTAPTNAVYGWATGSDVDADNTVAAILVASF